MSSTRNSESITQAITGMLQLARRDFLKFSAVSFSLAAVGGIAFPSSVLAAVPEGIRFMAEDEYKVFQRLMQTMFPVQGTQLATLDQIPVMQTLDAALLAGMTPYALSGLKEGVHFFEQGPLKLYGKPFSQLDDHQAAVFCDAWEASNDAMQRGLTTGLKKLVALSYWANPPTWAALGYDGPVSRRWGLKPLGNAPLPA
ncbi:MAG: twin-arginine translocation signal domain-containing protein [Gallionella sp.]|jgi:hypothetical protein